MRARLFLLAGALLAFGASVGSGFHFDDYGIFGIPSLGSLDGFSSFWHLQGTRPLTDLTFWLNRMIGGGDPLGYHLFNLAIHLGAVLLAWECLNKLLPERAAFIGAMLFAIHPMQSEPVTYVWARSILLAGLLCLASLWSWLQGRRWVAVLWFAMALLAKEEVVAFPLFVAWLEWRRATDGGRQNWKPILAMIALSVAAAPAVSHRLYTAGGVAVQTRSGVPYWPLILRASTATLRYLQLIVLPHGFTITPQIPTNLLLAFAGWAAIATLVIVALRRVPEVGTWLAGGFLLLLPSFFLIPVAEFATDRRMYLPMFAFSAAIALLLNSIRPRAVLTALGAIVLGISVHRTIVWMNDESLWREAVEHAPGKTMPKVQLARSLPAAQALELLNRARQAAPNDPAIAAEMGRILLKEGQPDAALDELSRALALEPMNPEYLNNRGVAFHALGQTEAARADFLRALKLNPGYADAKENLAKLPPIQQ